MQRVLNMILVVAMECLIGCTQTPTAVENETGRDIQIRVTYRTAWGPAYGPLEAGNRLRLRGAIGQIERIDYSYQGHQCTLTRDQVGAAALPGKYGEKYVVKLSPCS
jgi:hypothetical protein